MSDAVLSLSGVSKVFGHGDGAVRALSGIDVEVGRGELVVVTGPSGSGKTTLLQIAGALMSASSGEVIVEGTPLSDLGPRSLALLRAERIGFVFQSFNLFTNLDARGNVQLPTALLPRSRRANAKDPDTLLRDLGLERRARHLPGELSGGQQQRVAIARALVNDPPLILADEPTGNLDSQSGYLVLHVLERLAKDRGKTVLIVTHDFRFADVADRVLWLEDGEFQAAPTDEATEADPVCGMAIVPARAAAIRTIDGRTYVFCSQICVERFDRSSSAFVRTS